MQYTTACHFYFLNISLASLMLFIALHFIQRMSFVCEVCGRGYRSKQALNRHRTHHGERRFSCTSCEKNSSRNKNWSSIHIHMDLPKITYAMNAAKHLNTVLDFIAIDDAMLIVISTMRYM